MQSKYLPGGTTLNNLEPPQQPFSATTCASPDELPVERTGMVLSEFCSENIKILGEGRTGRCHLRQLAC